VIVEVEMEPFAEADTDIGRKKPSNEDAFLVDKRLRLYVVADGMGGHAAGDVASDTAVKEIRRFVQAEEPLIRQFADTGEGREEVLAMIEAAVRSAGRAIYERAQREPEKRGMGTTVSLLLLTPARGFIAHVGDSRVYLVREGEVYQLTEDHSLINELIRRGRLRPEDAANAPYQNALVRAVGVYPEVEVDVLDFEIAQGDNFMLCSDGLARHLRDDREIAEVLGTTELVAVPRRFIELANERGGEDNITSVVVGLRDAAAADTAVKLDILRQMPLFQHLTYVELVEILNLSEVRSYAADAPVFAEGDPGEELFVVLDGRVRIHKADTDLALLGPGGHFGEMALMDKEQRSASATAAMDSRLIAVGRRPLFQLMRRDKDLAVKLLWCFVQVLNKRLRTTSADLRQARQDHLELQDLLGLEEVEHQ
jgi:serine/threonine protein phosphatase PrpC/CRP-like cAMP-binding protein